MYFGSEDGHISHDMEELDKKFKVVFHYQTYRNRKLGNIVIQNNNADYPVYGCIVRKNKDDKFDFAALKKCMQEINKINKKDQYEYVGVSEVLDDDDCILMDKIINIMRYELRHVNIYICKAFKADKE